MAIVVQDTMTDGFNVELNDHVGEVGAAWTMRFSTNEIYVKIFSTFLAAQGPSWASASGTFASADQKVTVDFTISPAETNDTKWQVALRYDTLTSKFYECEYDEVAALWSIKYYNGASFTTLDTFAEAVPSAAFEIEFSVVGNVITLKKDGVTICSAIDSNHSVNGLLMVGSDPTGTFLSPRIFIDGLVAEDAAAASGPTAGTATAATLIVLDAPAIPGGLTAVASQNFTVTASAAVGANTNITLTSTGAAGVNAPVTPQIANGTTTQTFTRTPSAVGVTTEIKAAGPAGFTDATKATLNIAGTTGGTAPYTNQLQRSPHGANTWDFVGGGAVGAAVQLEDASVVPGGDYDYRFHITDDNDEVAFSNVVRIIVPNAVTYTSYSVQRYQKTFVAPYGASYTGEESAIGYTVYDGAGNVLLGHATGETVELPENEGVFVASIWIDENWHGVVVWDAPSGALAWCEPFFKGQPSGLTQTFVADYGAFNSGLEATLGYTVYDGDGNVIIAHHVGDTVELPGNNGVYVVQITFAAGSGVVLWDAPAGSEQIVQAYVAASVGGAPPAGYLSNAYLRM